METIDLIDCLSRGEDNRHQFKENFTIADGLVTCFGISPLPRFSVRILDQKKTVAASAIAERKTFGHLAPRVATRRQSLSRLNMIPMRLRRL